MYEELVKRLREEAEPCEKSGCVQTANEMRQAADAIEELSKRINGVTAERDAAMKRLCEWCGVGCLMENRRAELCEIAAVGLEFLAEGGTSKEWTTCQHKPPKEET